VGWLFVQSQRGAEKAQVQGIRQGDDNYKYYGLSAGKYSITESKDFMAKGEEDIETEREHHKRNRSRSRGSSRGSRGSRGSKESNGNRSRSGSLKSGIKDNVRKIIEVLIEDPVNQDRLRDSGVIPHLVTLISADQQQEELQGLALDALTMLSINNIRNQNEIAMSEGCRALKSLEQLVGNSMTPPKIMVRVVRLVGALCWKNKMVQGLMSNYVIIPHLVAMLDSYDNSLKKATLTALACTAEDSEKNKTQIIQLGTDRVIAKIMMKETSPTSLVAAAAQAIAALAKLNPPTQVACNRAVGHIVHLLEEAINAPHGSTIEDHIVQEQLCAALYELARNNKPNRSIMWKQDILRLVIEILYNTKASPYCLYNCLALLYECAKSYKKREKMSKNSDLLRAIRPLTESKDSLVRDVATRLTEYIRKR